MRAGRPMLVMPYSHDQPDNAARVTRLGIARTVARSRPTRRTGSRASYVELLDNPAYRHRAEEVGRRVREEDGVGTACRALEELLHGRIPEAAPTKVRQ